jgi:hypothetical protein
VHCVSPSDYILYVDREYSTEMLGVFPLLQPEMQPENLELWINSKTSGLTRMATSTSKGGVLQDLVIVDEVEQDRSELKDQFIDEVCSGSNKVIVLTLLNFIIKTRMRTSWLCVYTTSVSASPLSLSRQLNTGICYSRMS